MNIITSGRTELFIKIHIRAKFSLATLGMLLAMLLHINSPPKSELAI